MTTVEVKKTAAVRATEVIPSRLFKHLGKAFVCGKFLQHGSHLMI
jgi:hypothetical protein